jgi:hypothetical protein
MYDQVELKMFLRCSLRAPLNGEGGQGVREMGRAGGGGGGGGGIGMIGNRRSINTNFTSAPLPDTDQQHALSYLYTLSILSAQICKYLISSHVGTQYYLVLSFGKFTKMNVRPSGIKNVSPV